MLGHAILAGATLAVIFVMFLVIARTLNSVITMLVKLEYLVRKEYDLKKELLDVRRLMAQQEPGADAGGAGEAVPGRQEKK